MLDSQNPNQKLAAVSWALSRDDTAHAAKIVLAQMTLCMGDDGITRESQKSIAGLCSVSPETVRKYLVILENLNLITPQADALGPLTSITAYRINFKIEAMA